MAIVYAVKSGNWSDPTVWNTGSLPAAGDDVRSNTFTITVDGNYTVLTVSNKSETSPVVSMGGSFSLIASSILTATAATGFMASATLFNFSAAYPASAVINGHGSYSAHNSVLHSGTGTLAINGNIASNVSSGNAVSLTGSGILTVVGNLTHPNTNSPNSALFNGSTGTVNLIGNSTGWRNYSFGAQNASTGTYNITGNVYGATPNLAAWAGYGASNTSAGLMNITGMVYGGAGSNNIGAVNSSTGVLNISGSAYGSATAESNSSGVGAANSSTGVMRVTGPLNASPNQSAVSGSSSGVLAVTGPMLASLLGVQAINSPRWFWKQADQQPTYMQIRTQGDLSIRNLYTADSVGGNPAASHVRSGVTFGPNAELTGTCVIPPAAAVRVGVPVDDGIGTAALQAQDLWNVLLASMTVSGSIGERLKGAATAENVAEIVAATWSEG